jgi:hypothetical protein
METRKQLVAAAGALVLSAGLMTGVTVLGSVGSAAAEGCTNSGGAVMHPAPLRSYGVGSGGCGDQGACVMTTLYRGNRALASERRCGVGNVEAATEWVTSIPRDNLWADVQVAPN